MDPRINMPPIVPPTATPAIPPRDSPEVELDSGIELASPLGEAYVALAVAFLVTVTSTMDVVVAFVSSALGALTFTNLDSASISSDLLTFIENQ